MVRENLKGLCPLLYHYRIKHTREKLSWLLRPGAFAWSNGFILMGNAAVAVVIGSLLFLSALTLTMHTIQIYSQARDIREAAMAGRIYMEKLRQQKNMPMTNELKIMNRKYSVYVSVQPADTVYEIHKVEVIDSHGTSHTFKRVEKINKT